MPEGQTSISLEQEIARIERDLVSKRAALEEQKQAGELPEAPHEKETLKEVVREQYVSPVPSQPVPDSKQTAGSTPPPVAEPPSYLAPEMKDKVQELVNIAFTQTIDAAMKQARATNNAALIDAFHDALVDELYNYLVERGKIKKI